MYFKIGTCNQGHADSVFSKSLKPFKTYSWGKKKGELCFLSFSTEYLIIHVCLSGTHLAVPYVLSDCCSCLICTDFGGTQFRHSSL